MANIGPGTTNGSPFIYPSVTLLDRSIVTGHLFCLVKSSTANQYDVYRSTNNGGAWSLFASLTRANIVELGPIHVCRNGYLYVTYRNNENDKDRVHFQRLNVSTVIWGGEHLVTEWSNGGVAGAALTGMDLYPFVPMPGGVTYVVVAVGVQAGSNHGAILYGAVIQPSGVTASTTGIFQGTRSWVAAGSGRITPSLDLQHDGSGKVGSGSHLWLAFGRSRLQLVKLARTSTGWSGPSSALTIRSDLGADDYIPARWDGALFCMAVPNPSDPLTVLLIERNSANSNTTTRTSPAHPAGNVRNCMLTYDRVSRATRIYAVGTSSSVLYFVDFVRTTGLWTSWGQVSATPILGTNADNYGVRRGSHGTAKHDVYTAHSGSPNTAVHTPQALSYAPNTPTWVNTTGQAANVSANLTLDWDFSDPDPADTQTAYAISRQIGSGAVEYLRDADGTWNATEQKNINGSTFDILSPALWATGGSGAAPHTYKVKVWDSADLPSAYSDALVVIPSGVVSPTITAPTEGQVLNGDSLTVTWTVAEQSAFRVVLKILTAVDYDSGWVAGTDLSHTIPRVLGDGFSYSVFLTTRNLKGLPSVEQQKNFSVDFNEPAQGTVVPTALPASGVIRVVATNPATVLVSDGYGRTTSNGLGNADSGQTYTNSGTASDYSANGSVGQHSLTSVNVSRRSTVPFTAADFDQVIDYNVAVLATGAAINVGIMGRHADANNQYFAEILLNTDQTVQVRVRKNVASTLTTLVTSANVSGLTHTVGRWFRLRFQGQGTALRARVWDRDASEPTIWHVDTTDSSLAAAGDVGPRTLLASGNTNTLPVAVSFDNYTASTIQAAFASQEIWRRKVDPAAVTLYSQNFEDGASGTGWELIGTGAGTQRSNEQAHDGSWSFKVVPDGVAGTARASSPFITGIVPGELYFIEGWLRASLNTKPVGVLARWYTSGDVFISESQFPIVPIAGVWRHVTQTPIAPATAAKLRIGPAVHSTPAAGNILYGDELRVSKANIDAGTRIATGLSSGATYDDYTAVSGQPYEYRALVRGANSTAIFGPWTA